MRFLSPAALYLLFALPVVILGTLLADRRARRIAALFGEDRLIAVGRLGPARWVTRTKKVLFLAALGFLCFALGRPQWGERIEDVKRKGLDIIIALDVSASMDATDIKPSRLEAARGEISAFLDLLEGDRVGLVCFAGEAALICPLTLDYSALKIFLDTADSATISRPGTAIGSAIDAAAKGFDQKEKRYKVIVLLTDGENHVDDPTGSARKAREQGIAIFTIGIGTPNGELVPVKDAEGRFKEYKKDENGEFVKSRLDVETLQQIAVATDGKFFAITTGGDELKRIAEEIASMDKKEVSARLQTVYEERFQWFLLPALVLFLIWGIVPEVRR